MLLSSIVTDICTRAGISSSSLDVADLTTIDVIGYTIPRQMPARTALETLMAVYNFDAAEEDWKLVFKLRGSTSVATIAANEMRAHVYGDSVPSIAVETRTQDIDLPTHFTLTYESKVRDYEIASQNAIRIDKQNFLQQESQLGIVLNDTYAKQQAEVILKQIWGGRHKYAFATTNKYIKLAPGDVITVNGKAMRVISMADRDGVIEFIAEAEEGGSYTSYAEADDLTIQAQDLTESTSIPTFIALDIPAISGDFGNIGLTVAMYNASGYSGGVLQRSADGAEYTDVAYFSTVCAVVGNCGTVALSSGLGKTIDNSQSITVDLSTSGGSIASIGSSLLWEGGNLAAVGTTANGWELIQFQTVTSSTASTSVYTVTGLLRGLYGTEHLRASHTTADKFVLLTNTSGALHGGVDFVTGAITDNGVNYFWRTKNYYESVSTVIHTIPYGRKTLDPYAPQIAFGSRNSSNDIDLNWYRGDRYEFEQVDMPDGVDVTMNEVSLNYQVNVIHPVSSAVVRTVQTTASTWTYTAAMQSTDAYPQTHPIIFDIYQLSTVTSTGGAALRVSI